MPPVTTRTIGPLHLEDLEPHRFEDLVRQLLYDFRHWVQIEATGRAGGDDGFDVRAWERGSSIEPPEENEAEEVGEPPALSLDRQWLVQCKREKVIGPSRLDDYLAIVPADGSLAGLVFVAACDFSKKARDRFREKIRSLGIEEGHLWGKAELEDQLFQPKNDHLLFAYFGVSLQTRRRSLQTATRNTVSMKRKVKRLLYQGNDYLIRDVSDERYPWRDEGEDARSFRHGRWRVFRYQGLQHDGLHFEVQHRYAYLSEDGKRWDWSERINLATPHHMRDPWATKDGSEFEVRQQVHAEWEALPEDQRAWAKVEVVLPVEVILDIDDVADDWFDQPHILVADFDSEHGPFKTGFVLTVERLTLAEPRWAYPSIEDRVPIFTKDGNAPESLKRGTQTGE